MAKTAAISPAQLRAISVLERVGSTLSLLGCCFIILTFLSHLFRKPINRLVFYASLGNVFTNVATLIAVSAMDDPHGAACQVQAFLIQMFMPADAYWTLAMAMNVFLTFYRHYDAPELRSFEKWYLLGCYGAPFVPALIYTVATSGSKHHMYGNATLWCWISSEWDILRIVTFYMPVWIAILITMGIYVWAGRIIFNRRTELQIFTRPRSRQSPRSPLSFPNPFASLKTTTEFSITHEPLPPASMDSIDLRPLGGKGAQKIEPPPPTAKGHYSWSVSAQNGSQKQTYDQKPSQIPAISTISSTSFASTASPKRRLPTRQYNAGESTNVAAWSYTKVAFLFFVALMVTWVPSSANRVYSLVHPDRISIPLELASALVLPLQGFWNAVVYIFTSWDACKELWRHFTSPRCTVENGFHNMGAGGQNSGLKDQKLSRSRAFNNETESITELAGRHATNLPDC